MMFMSLSLALSASRAPLARAAVMINEVADKGSTGVCDGEDWVELFNSGSETVSLAGFVLHDDKGPQDSKAFTFPNSASIAAQGYLTLCCKSASGFQFKIGGDDTVTLLDADGAQLATSGPLPDDGADDKTWAYRGPSEDRYEYTTVPTFGEKNVFSTQSSPSQTPAPVKQTHAEKLLELAAQNARGELFFGMDGNGLKVEGSESVVDLEITMAHQDFDYMMANASFEVYSPVQSFAVRSSSGVYTLPYPGRMRPRGQSTLFFPTCAGLKSIPFLLDFNSENRSQTLFGVEKGYLRNGYGDSSYLREWTAHRMLARFGLPFLRARSVRLLINGDYVGLYLFMEAPDQEYVFARGFPDYNPANFALYKVKTTSLNCGGYNHLWAMTVPTATETTKFAFHRGEHRSQIPVLKDTAYMCGGKFMEGIENEFRDMIRAWKLHNRNCGEALVKEGRIDRDLGGKESEPMMKKFINDFLVHHDQDSGVCKKNFDCSTTGLEKKVDADQWMKNYAFYAVLQAHDTPLGNGNNWYLAQAADGKGWKILQYDHNAIMNPGDFFCPKCRNNERWNWAVTRPRCEASDQSQLTAPLFKNATLFDRYLGYVRDFTERVLTNSSLYAEVLAHAKALQPLVGDDPFAKSKRLDYSREVSAQPWAAGEKSGPVLSFLTQRGESVKMQLDAWDKGKFPRAPGQVPAEESCQDWRTTEQAAAAKVTSDKFVYDPVLCPKELRDCKEAAGCYIHDLACDKETGKMLHAACAEAKLWCGKCYPYSRCGSLKTKDDKAVTSDGFGLKSLRDPTFLIALAAMCFQFLGCRGTPHLFYF